MKNLAMLAAAAFLLAPIARAANPPISDEVLKLRDPFKRPVFLNKEGLPKPELETIPIEQFKMAGAVTGPSKLKAMLIGPNNKTYFVTENMRIGVRKGVIRRITPDAVYVREKIVNVLGKEEDVNTEIKLPSDGGSSLVTGSGW